MDSVDSFPNYVFRVSVYNSRLEHKTKSVIVYKTEDKHVKSYKIQGFEGTITIRRSFDCYTVSWTGKHKGSMTQPLWMIASEMVPVAATHMLNTLVVYLSETEPSLF